MTSETKKKLARSLTAVTTELLPFLPYLLQDLWELGSNPREMISLLERHMPVSDDTKILDLACGKGAMSINIAQNFNVNVYGYDSIREFIGFAKQKAKEWNVEKLCHFTHGDANDIVQTEKNYDCVIFSGAGNILGSPQQTIKKLVNTIKPKGFILIDEAYYYSSNDGPKCKYDYLTHAQWLNLFEENGLVLLEEMSFTGGNDRERQANAILMRANELKQKYPDKREMFDGYVQSKLDECSDLDDRVVIVNWLVQLGVES